MKEIYCVLFIGFFFSVCYAKKPFSYEREKELVTKHYDSLVFVFGEEDLVQKKFFIESICKHSEELYTGVKIDDASSFEEYLKQLAKKLDPNFKGEVFLFKSPYPNAFTIFNGDLFFHWGLIADAESEASLAYTVGHEIGHFSGAHIFKSFIESNKKGHLNQDQEIQKYHDSQSHEYYSDSIGFEMASKAGYDWKSGLVGFYEYLSLDTIMNHLEKKANIFNARGELINEVFYDASSDTLFSSHPPTGSRIRMREMMGRKWSQKGEKYLVSKENFIAMQEYARIQILDRLMQTCDYKYGLIKSFKYYCLEPNNKEFKYYLLEFLRRKYLGKKKVLSYTLFSDVFKFSQNKSIYDNLRWIFRSKTDLLKAESFINSTLKKQGNTYQSLLDYLEKTCDNEVPEFYLSMAMQCYKNKEKKAKYLNIYLNFQKVKYREFAAAYQKGELGYQLKNNKNYVFLYMEPFSTKINAEVTVDAPQKAHDLSGVVVEKIVAKQNKEGKTIFFDERTSNRKNIDNFIATQLAPFMFAKVFSDHDAGNITFSGSVSTHLASPELWTFFEKNDVKMVYLNQNFLHHDETVTPAEDRQTKLNSAISEIKMVTSSNYFGRSIDSYQFRMISLRTMDYQISKRNEWGVTRLSKGKLKKEIRKILHN